MYLDIQKEPNRDGKWTMFIFILAVAFVMLCATCEGQVDRLRPYKKFPNIVQLTVKSDLIFTVDRGGIKDKISLGVHADSLKKDTYYMAIHVFFPKETYISNTELIIGFKNGGIEILPSTFINKEYVEYQVTNEQYLIFRDKQYEYINFKLNGYDISFEDDENPNYFCAFFKQL